MSTFTDVLEFMFRSTPAHGTSVAGAVVSLMSRDSDDHTSPPVTPEAPSLGGRIPVRWIDAWRRLAQRMGFVVDPARGAWTLTIEGVTAELHIEARGHSHFVLRASVPCPNADGLFVMSSRLALTSAGCLATGDEELDAEVLIAASDETILGAFDAATRRALRAFTQVGGVIANGRIELGPEAMEAITAREADRVLGLMLAIGERLAASRAERLMDVIEIIRADPDPAVRQAMHARFGGHQEVRAAASSAASSTEDLRAVITNPFNALSARAAALEQLLVGSDLQRLAPFMKDVPPELIARAADFVASGLAAGRIPAPIGLALVAYLDHNPAITTPVRVQLLDALGRTRDGSLASWLTTACDAPAAPVARAALGALMRLEVDAATIVKGLSHDAMRQALFDAPEVVIADPSIGADVLAAMLVRVSPDAYELRVRYFEALALAGAERHADLVVPHLQGPDERTRLAAIRALGAIGGAAHVEVLSELTGGLFRSSTIKDEARAAVQSIHERIGSHLRGGMSVSGADQRGGVSLEDA